jgi:hypothetical protein
MAIKQDYGILTYYPDTETWVITFVSTDKEQNLEHRATASAGGVQVVVFEVLRILGERGWEVFQVDGYIERDYPVYHLRRAVR